MTTSAGWMSVANQVFSTEKSSFSYIQSSSNSHSSRQRKSTPKLRSGDGINFSNPQQERHSEPNLTIISSSLSTVGYQRPGPCSQQRQRRVSSVSERSSWVPDETAFSLRRIDPHEILKLYRSGHFANCSIPVSKISLEMKTNQPNYGNSKYDEAYQVKEGGLTRSYVTAGQDDFIAAYLKIQNGFDPSEISLLKTGKCHGCNKKLSKLPENAVPAGIPTKVVKKGNYYIFDTKFKYCTFSCAYNSLLAKLHNKFGNSILEDSIQYLKFMYHLMYPGRELTSVPDTHLQQENGGPIPNNTYFYQTPNIICLPTKQEYAISDESFHHHI
mgnify:CR=1 FL=1